MTYDLAALLNALRREMHDVYRGRGTRRVIDWLCTEARRAAESEGCPEVLGHIDLIESEAERWLPRQ